MDQNQGGTGPLIGAIIVVIVLVAGGVYFFGMQKAPESQSPTTQNEQTAASEIPNDDLASIEADVTATDVNSNPDIDTALTEINKELDAK